MIEAFVSSVQNQKKGIRFITTSYQLIKLLTGNRYFTHDWL